MKTKPHSLTILTGALVFLFASSLLVTANDDDQIEKSAKKSYVFKTYLKDQNIDIESSNGTVKLTGTVDDIEQKQLAESAVEDLPGVTKVYNMLEVKNEDTDSPSDLWLTTKVKSTLLFHKNTSFGNTDVYVSNGVVTLRGMAASQTQKDLTEAYVSDIKGVSKVVNELKVVSVAGKESRDDKNKVTVKDDDSLGDKINDASITAQVKASLLFHKSTSGLSTDVDTKDGVVTVSGVASSEAEKLLVTKLVEDVNGVFSVINVMTVDPSSVSD